MLASRRYLEATREVEVLTPTGDREKLKTLGEEAFDAAQSRELARQAVQDHAATHPGAKPETLK